MDNQSSYDRTRDLKAFDSRKTGVKGLLDEATREVELEVPNIFIRPLEDRSNDLKTCTEDITIPIIDLAHVNEKDGPKPEIIKEILLASETWGFFQVVNHGIPVQVLNNMIEGTRMFHEQNDEVKKEYYSRDMSKVVTYNTNYDFYKSKSANWRDSLVVIANRFIGSFNPQDLPPICREAILEYLKHTLNVGDIILELLSLALGLEQDYLSKIRSREAWSYACHYYPACPKPELTLGTSKHTDSSFITMVLQDQIGGLQVLHDNQWVNVTPRPGALIVNIGDLLQIISNDRFKSVSHRVIAQTVGPRVSIALFLQGMFSTPEKYGPIKELLSEENHPIYKDFTLLEFFTYFYSRPVDQSELEYFKL